jgi:hypothetical protein
VKITNYEAQQCVIFSIPPLFLFSVQIFFSALIVSSQTSPQHFLTSRELEIEARFGKACIYKTKKKKIKFWKHLGTTYKVSRSCCGTKLSDVISVSCCDRLSICDVSNIPQDYGQDK